jgi:hypothetical protein
MAIAIRCEACQTEAAAAAPGELHAFLDRHRDPDVCAERGRRGTQLRLRLFVPVPVPLPRSA